MCSSTESFVPRCSFFGSGWKTLHEFSISKETTETEELLQTTEANAKVISRESDVRYTRRRYPSGAVLVRDKREAFTRTSSSSFPGASYLWRHALPQRLNFSPVSGRMAAFPRDWTIPLSRGELDNALFAFLTGNFFSLTFLFFVRDRKTRRRRKISEILGQRTSEKPALRARNCTCW